jgi:hypothetical protein
MLMLKFVSTGMRIAALFLLATVTTTTNGSAKNIRDIVVSHTGVFRYHPDGPDITALRATMVVPQDPVIKSNQSLAMWVGLQPEDSKAVLQAVLQWGEWANGGGESWGLACWVATQDSGGDLRHRSTKIIPVQPGTRITAVLELISVDGGKYKYRCSFEGYSETAATWVAPSKLNTAMIEYQTADSTACGQYTNDVTFTNVQLMIGGVQNHDWWKLMPITGKLKDQAKGCGMRVKGIDRTTFTIGPGR